MARITEVPRGIGAPSSHLAYVQQLFRVIYSMVRYPRLWRLALICAATYYEAEADTAAHHDYATPRVIRYWRRSAAQWRKWAQLLEGVADGE